MKKTNLFYLEMSKILLYYGNIDGGCFMAEAIHAQAKKKEKPKLLLFLICRALVSPRPRRIPFGFPRPRHWHIPQSLQVPPRDRESWMR